MQKSAEIPIDTAQNAELMREVDAVIDRLYAVSPSDLRERKQQADGVTSIGHKLQAELTRKSVMLRKPMQSLMQGAEDGGPVAENLQQLQQQVTGINPNQYNFDLGGLRKLLSWMPFIGTPVSKWLVRYQSVEAVIEEIITRLQSGKAQLEQDNLSLSDDQSVMQELAVKLEDYVKFGQLLDKRLEARIQADTDQLDKEKKNFLQQEVQFPLRQRVLDLQSQLAVQQQAALTAEVIIRNNQELIRGVERALNVTVPALNTAATLALALQAQKNVLSGVKKVSETTNELIGQTAEKLKTQGVEIQTQAASVTLGVDKLKAAFANVESALQDISIFRQQALPQMAHSITEMDDLTTKMEKSIRDMEKGRDLNTALEIEVGAK